jgi:SpoVK/Ycf46/Vps4 family AAA+-type ATPase
VEHLSEVVKILDAALMHDTEKATAYANLLASKLDDDRQPRQARAVRTVIAKLPTSRVSGAYANARIPKDRENSLPIIDFKLPDELPDQDLVLPPDVRGRVAEFLESIRMHGEWDSHGVSSANRLLIYGPPGTGKTSIAAMLAKELQSPLIVSRSDALMSSLLGQTSRNIRSIFDFAESTPSVLFLDEFDALAKDRKDAREIGELQRVVIALLQNIDALDPATVVVAATNHPELLDPAVWRRFEFTLKLDYPDADMRRSIWVQALGKFAPEEQELMRLVDLSDGMSGAAIKVVANDVARVAIKDGGRRPPLPVILRRLARILWYASHERFRNDASEMASLREWAPDVFTLRALGELFEVSTRQVTNAIKGAGRAGSRANSAPSSTA